MLRKEKHEQSLRDLWEAIRDQVRTTGTQEAIRDQCAYHRNPGDTETAQSNTRRNITPDFPDLMKDKHLQIYKPKEIYIKTH